jgi:dihydrolipoamide dehydrogenase
VSPVKEINTQIAILGGGPAGYMAALRAAQSGVSTVIIEEREIGGTCLNRGCIPTKALIGTSEAAYLIDNKSRELGIHASIASLDFNASIARKDRVVKNLRMGLEQLLISNKVHIVKGKGEVHNPRTILVRSETEEIIVSCDKLIIATGSEPSIPDIPGITLDGVMNSDEALELRDIPESVLIIGAGAIGLEFASLFNALHAKVTVVEFQNTILPQEDKEIASELLKIMKRQGIKFRLSSEVREIRETRKAREGGTGLEAVIVDEEKKESIINTSKVLVAAGRKPRTTPDIAALGIKVRERGAVAVNENMETHRKGVYAAGDVIGGKLLAHLAFAEGKIAMQNALGTISTLNYDTVPSCVYTNPEIASVGLSEEEAKRRGFEVKAGRFDFRKNGRALCLGERDGFVKIITDKNKGTILGGQILGAYDSELI